MVVLALLGVWLAASELQTIPGLPGQSLPVLVVVAALGLYVQRIVADARESIRFHKPFLFECVTSIWRQPAQAQPDRGLATVCRVPIECRRNEDTVSFESHLGPPYVSDGVVTPPIHRARAKDPWNSVGGDMRTVTLRNGQEAFVDLIAVQQTAEGWECRLLAVVELASGGSYRAGPLLRTGRYEVVLRAFYSDRHHDEQSYQVVVDVENGSLKVRTRR